MPTSSTRALRWPAPTRRRWSLGLPVAVAAIITCGLGTSAPASAASPAPPPTNQVTYALASPDAEAPPPIAAASWVVADAQTGDILAARDANRQLPPASTLKLLTALTVVPALQLDSIYTANLKDVHAPGTRIGLYSGSTYRVRDLLHGLLLASGNDAASGLAFAYGGRPAAVAAMNSEARRIGAAATVAANPSGLDARGQVTTAADLATIYRAALEVPAIRETLQLKKAEFPRPGTGDPDERSRYPVPNPNRLIVHDYPGILGAKSGFTSGAGRTYVAGAEQNGHRLIVSLMHSATNPETAAAKLLDWGFANTGRLTPVGKLPESTTAPQALTPRPAAVFDELARPVTGQDGFATAQSAPGNSTAPAVLPESTSDLMTDLPPVSPSWWLILFWSALALLAAVVALRIRAVVRLRRRQAAKSAPDPNPGDTTEASSEKPGRHLELVED